MVVNLGLGTLGVGAGLALNGITLSVLTNMSIAITANAITLANDSASPGNSKVYSTNGTGTRGWNSIGTALGNALIDINSVTSVAASDFVLGAGSFGGALTIDSSSGSVSTMSVTSIANLHALSVGSLVTGRVVLVAGYYAAGDGGGGIFQYSSSSSATDNGGTVIAPTVGSGRWLRLFSGPVYVTWFGAKGDGITDDVSSIQAAINFMRDNGGGTIIFESKPYAVGSTVVMYSTLRIEGVSAQTYLPADEPFNSLGARLIWIGGDSGAIVSLENTQGVIWDGVDIFGNRDASPTTAVDCFVVNSHGGGSFNSQRNIFRNFVAAKAKRGLAFDPDDTDAGNTDGWLISNFTIYNVDKGIYLNSVNIAYSRIERGAIFAKDAGVDFNRCGWVECASVTGSKFGANDNGTVFNIGTNSGTLLFTQCQSEYVADVSKFNFAILAGTKVTPTTFISNVVSLPLRLTGTHSSLTLTGNQFNASFYLSGDNSLVRMSSNHFIGGQGISNSGNGNAIFDDSTDGYGTFTPHIFQGATEITSWDALVGYYIKRDRFVFIYINGTKLTGAPSASGVFTITGLPLGNTTLGPFTYAAGSCVINGTQQLNASPQWWTQATNTTILTLNGSAASTSWSSSFLQFFINGTIITDPI